MFYIYNNICIIGIQFFCYNLHLSSVYYGTKAHVYKNITIENIVSLKTKFPFKKHCKNVKGLSIVINTVLYI